MSAYRGNILRGLLYGYLTLLIISSASLPQCGDGLAPNVRVRRCVTQSHCETEVVCGKYLPDLRNGTRVETTGSMCDGFDGRVAFAGPSTMDMREGRRMYSKAKEIRKASRLFVNWMNTVRGGLRVGGKRYCTQTSFISDHADPFEVAAATAAAGRAPVGFVNATYLIGGYSTQLTRISAKQAKIDQRVFVSAGASASDIFADEGDLVFGLLPTRGSVTSSIYDAVIEAARQADAGVLSATGTSECFAPSCTATLRLGLLGMSGLCGSRNLSNAVLLAERSFKMVSYVDVEDEPDVAQEHMSRALAKFKAEGVTVLEICNFYSYKRFKAVIKELQALDYAPYAIIAGNQIFNEEYTFDLAQGWWQGGLVLDATNWIPEQTTKMPPGAFSNMTTNDFVAYYLAEYDETPSYTAAAQFAALCALSAAIEIAETTDSLPVGKALNNLSLHEFYGYINFSSSGQLVSRNIVAQASGHPDARDPFPFDVVFPASRADSEIYFPLPSWKMRHCQHELGCSNRGHCSQSGVCICDAGWKGPQCENVDIESNERSTVIWVSVVFGLLTVIAVGFAAARWLKRRRNERVKRILIRLEEGILKADSEEINVCSNQLHLLGWTQTQVHKRVQEIGCKLSQESGVSVAYLLSHEFAEFARERTGKEDPTFNEMKVFFFSEPGIGADQICPRDDKQGCAFVDTLPRKYRNRCTHFLSWTWAYRLSVVRDALQAWINAEKLDASEVFLFMCFFVNNQYRILVEETTHGAENLNLVFEANLRRINHVIALLDTFEMPVYFTRIWTIFEQFTAIKLGVPVTMILPPDSAQKLLGQFDRGKEGILFVKDAVSKIDCKSSRASFPQDEAAVKELIVKDCGFAQVDRKIEEFLIEWVGQSVELYLKELVNGPVSTSGEDDVEVCKRVVAL